MKWRFLIFKYSLNNIYFILFIIHFYLKIPLSYFLRFNCVYLKSMEGWQITNNIFFLGETQITFYGCESCCKMMFALNAFWQINYWSLEYDVHYSFFLFFFLVNLMCTIQINNKCTNKKSISLLSLSVLKKLYHLNTF